MQISRSDDEQSTHLKTSFEASEEKIDQQIEHFNNSNRIYLKNEYRRSSSHLFDHRTVSIHLLCIDLIRFERRTRLQTERECRIDLYEKYLNSSSSSHLRSFQIHRRNCAERKTLFVFNTSTVKHDHLRRAITFDHQFDVFFH